MPHGRGRLVDDLLQDRVDLLALREQLVEHVLAEHRPQRRLRDLRRRDHEVLDLDDRVLRLDDPEVGDRVHAHRDVVLGDHLLRRDVQRDRPQVDLDHPVDDRDQQEEARALRLRQQPAEPEDDPALVLARHLDRRDQEEHDEEAGRRRGSTRPAAIPRPYSAPSSSRPLGPTSRARARRARARSPSAPARAPELAVDEAPEPATRTTAVLADDAVRPDDRRAAAAPAPPSSARTPRSRRSRPSTSATSGRRRVVRRGRVVEEHQHPDARRSAPRRSARRV